MIGILIVTHCQLGEALIDASEFIIGSRPEKTESVTIDLNVSAEKLRKAISNGIKKVGQEDGVLILTDMFGGTPSNLSYTFLEEGRIEVVSGVNLPMLIKAVNTRGDSKIGELATSVEAFGKKSISMASGILKGNKRG
jgi:PTS system mannose-specific IIA component